MNAKHLKIIKRYCKLNSFNFEVAKKDFKQLPGVKRVQLMKEMRTWLKVHAEKNDTKRT